MTTERRGAISKIEDKIKTTTNKKIESSYTFSFKNGVSIVGDPDFVIKAMYPSLFALMIFIIVVVFKIADYVDVREIVNYFKLRFG